MKKKLTQEQNQELIKTLKSRFEKNMNRHKDLDWNEIQSRLEQNSEKLWSLYEMERTGGEPDITGYFKERNEFIFCDCSQESPEGRRNICYDREGQDAREKKGVRPAGNAIDIATSIGLELLTEEQYFDLQKLGNFDTKTSSWLWTPPEVRKLGGALFADRRYGRVFIYHNSAPSFYSVRAFRGRLLI